ncbi:MAG: hypothetical protein CMN30_09810 [Sandaracinus sp.]|nr:hypothetical protein [Sandaracinus sp.]
MKPTTPNHFRPPSDIPRSSSADSGPGAGAKSARAGRGGQRLRAAPGASAPLLSVREPSIRGGTRRFGVMRRKAPASEPRERAVETAGDSEDLMTTSAIASAPTSWAGTPDGPSSPGQAPTSEERPRHRPLAGKSILIVEDVDDALFLMAQLLELSGAEVHQASNGREALALLDGGLVPDLVVSDIGMPEMDGYELMSAIRERDLPRQPPAVAVTAFSQRQDRIRAMKAGFQSHVAKPADAEEIVAVLVSLSTLVDR